MFKMPKNFTRNLAFSSGVVCVGLCVVFVLYHLVRWGAGDRPRQPVIVVDQYRVDLGRLRPLQSVERVLTIENRGGGVLKMEEPTATCGCQKPHLKRRVLGPGERTELTLKQTARPDDVELTHMVSIKSNDPQTPVTNILLVGVVSRGVVVAPEPVVFDSLKPGEIATRQIELSSDDGTEFSLTHVNAEGQLTASAVLNRPAILHRIAVKLRGAKPYGPFKSALIVNTDQKDGYPLTIGVVGSVVGPVHITPTALSLGSLRGLQEVKRIIFIESDMKNLTIESCEASLQNLEVSYRVLSRQTAERRLPVELAFRVPNASALIDCEVRIEVASEDGQREVVSVPVTGLVANAVQVDFGK